MSRKIKKSDCFGCHNEIYHCGGASGLTNECWNFSGAELSLGRKQHRDELPKNYRGVYKLIPNCYVYQIGFIERKNNKK